MLEKGIRVGAILINYNARDDTKECINSLLDQDYSPIEIYVVDNASPDGSGIALQEEFIDKANVHVILNEENLGFSAGNNIGIREAFCNGCSAVLLINNDTIADSSLVTELLGELDYNNIVAPYMYYYTEPRRLWFAGGYFNWRGQPLHMTDLSSSHSVDFITGCCLMYSREVYDLIGEWDERYFLYFEDCDFSARAASAGVHLRMVPAAVLWHKVSSSTGKDSRLTSYYKCRNKLLFVGEHEKAFLPLSWAWGTVLLRCLMPGSARVARVAMSDYMSGRFGILKGASRIE